MGLHERIADSAQPFQKQVHHPTEMDRSTPTVRGDSNNTGTSVNDIL